MRSIYRVIRNIFKMLKYFTEVKEVVNMPSYYPEYERKSKITRYIENYKYIVKYRDLNIFYNLYGMDIKEFNNTKNDYCNYLKFKNQRNKYNMQLNTPKEKYNYIVLLRDKNIFEKYMNSIGIRTAKTIAIIKNGKIYNANLDEEIKDIDIFEKDKTYFIKSINSECAEDVYCIKGYEDYINIKEKLNKGMYIVQDKLIQNSKMNELNPSSINTLRVVTTNDGKNIKILGAACRIGTKKSGNVDNWSAGGIAVEINEEGKLNKYGYYKPGYGTKSDKHPNTNVEFENFEIPSYKEVIDTVIKAHKALYGIHSIGWDVVIDEQGPILLEGNDNWAISLMQISRGLKEKWENTLYTEKGSNNEK